MDWDVLGVIGLICLIAVILIVEFAIVWIVAGLIASMLGLTGLYWWCVAIVVFLFINAVFGALNRIGGYNK